MMHAPGVIVAHTLWLQIAQSKLYLLTLGPKVGIMYILGAEEAKRIGLVCRPGSWAKKSVPSSGVDAGDESRGFACLELVTWP